MNFLMVNLVKQTNQSIMNKKIEKFLQQSNYIEREYGDIALEDAKKAWEFAYKNKNKLTLDYILEIHRLLMQRLRPDIAGKWRNCDVYIGGQRKYFISEYLIKTDLQQKVIFEMLANGIKDKEEKAKQVHIAFEYVHCFTDGNGRCGRILLNIHRINLGLSILIVHEGEEQMNYYKWFR